MNKTKHIAESFFKGEYPAEKNRELQTYLFSKTKTEEMSRAMAEIWEELPPIPASSESVASFEKLQKQLNTERVNKSRLSSYHTWIQIAAIWLLTLIPTSLAIFYAVDSYYADGTSIIEYQVPAGKTEQVILADGTSVWLNSGSVLLYPKQFTSAHRSVYLSGEGYFEVVREKRPFKVNTLHQRIEVLGTAFNLNAYPEAKRVVTTLERGSIAVSLHGTHNATITMKPNECLAYDPKEDVYTLTETKAPLASKWREGVLVFRNSPFEEVITALARHFGKSVEFENHNHANNRLTISLNKDESLEVTLKLIQATVSEMNFRIENTTIYIK